MNGNEKETDWLKPLFSRLPEEDLPSSFREEMMKRVRRESARIRKRHELAGLFTVILASAGVMGLAAGALVRTGVPRIAWKTPDIAALSFYLYIGFLALLLLGADYLLRRIYRKKHPG
jgi:hypothetical protein